MGVYGEGDKARMPGMFKGLKLKGKRVTCLEEDVISHSTESDPE